MPREIDGERYYEATEVCKRAGISRPTLFRWLKRGLLINLHRDRRGWRMETIHRRGLEQDPGGSYKD